LNIFDSKLTRKAILKPEFGTAISTEMITFYGYPKSFMNVDISHLDGDLGSIEVERMLSQHVFQPQKINVRTQCHLAHAVRVEVKLILDNFGKMLTIHKHTHIIM